MKTLDDSNEDRGLKAPEKLVSALRQAQSEPVFVPPTLDEAILRAARSHLAQDTKPRSNWLPMLPWIAAATAMIVAVALITARFQSRNEAAKALVFLKEDVNHDGRVDILDAFALARHLKHLKVSDTRLDLNGDGVVDERDIRIIAAEAVKLDRKGSS